MNYLIQTLKNVVDNNQTVYHFLLHCLKYRVRMKVLLQRKGCKKQDASIFQLPLFGTDFFTEAT